ncbi:MAG: hypothetical protein C5B59_13390 [Bacteroidetes bacterium]|nr:MAG: hypothetical protein C5B59_13390 [Bacteroidota bacterium]
MISNNSVMTERKKMTWIFSGFYVASILLLILTLTVFWDSAISDQPRDKNGLKLTMNQQLSNADRVLNDNLVNLQQLDNRFIGLLADSGIRANFEPLVNKIISTELLLRKNIDSIKTSNATKRNAWQFNDITAPYLAVLDSRRALDNLQKAVSLGSKQMDTDQQYIARLKGDLSQKGISNAEIENMARIQKPSYSLNSSSSDLRLLRAQNEFLKSEMRILQMKNAKLQNSNSSLGRDYDPFAVEQTNDPANNSNTPTLYRPKAKNTDKTQSPKYQNQ